MLNLETRVPVFSCDVQEAIWWARQQHVSTLSPGEMLWAWPWERSTRCAMNCTCQTAHIRTRLLEEYEQGKWTAAAAVAEYERRTSGYGQIG